MLRVGARANASAQVDRDQSGQDASVVTKPLHSRYTAVTQPQLRWTGAGVARMRMRMCNGCVTDVL